MRATRVGGSFSSSSARALGAARQTSPVMQSSSAIFRAIVEPSYQLFPETVDLFISKSPVLGLDAKPPAATNIRVPADGSYQLYNPCHVEPQRGKEVASRPGYEQTKTSLAAT